ncbi:MAG: TRAP transporter fused permease subunit, partial [Syntrophorhabdaceae bacterium]|nr:TRAP transporter fused permease subunit [Syntrophorhabdaceae bacterium]
KWIIVVLSAFGIFLAIDQVFYLSLLGNLDLENSYSYLLMALFLSSVFLTFRLNGQGKYKTISVWLDGVLFLASLLISLYMAVEGYDILMKGWSAVAPMHMIVLSTILWFLVLEATRRTGGLALSIVVACFSFYPLWAELMPGLLKGAGLDFQATVAYHIMSPDSALGIPLKTVGNILIGYLIFGVALGVTGAGDFFLKLATSLFGHARGGVAKVAVIASALFGSVNGSAVANVMTIGSITIPLMKRVGYPAHFAAAVEACASNGGQLMPPVMGAVAFVMASFLNIPYLHVVLAAIVPSLLYYFGLLVQVDGRAVSLGLSGLPKSELPSFRETIKEGWFYLFSLIILLTFLFYRMETQAPFYASVFLLLITNLKKNTRLSPKKAQEFFYGFAQTMIQLVAILCAVGMVIGSLAITGVAHAFPSEILHLAGKNLPFMIFLTAMASFILGMGMSAIAVYIFTAVILAPALVELGLNVMAVHMFLLYCGILSFITPPVCIAVYPAAAFAGASVMKTGWTAVRLGAVLFIIPFFFIIEPALVLQGSISKIIYSCGTAFFGVWLLASSLEGYLAWVGRFGARKGDNKFEWFFNNLLRCGLFISGFLFMIPGILTDIAGLMVAACVIPLQYKLNRRSIDVK